VQSRRPRASTTPPRWLREPSPTLEFRPLFDAHLAFVGRVLRRCGVPDRELEDARQEVFLIVHRKLCEFEGRASVRTWVYAIAARVALVTLRKPHLRRELLVSAPSEPVVDGGQESAVVQRSAVEAALRALHTMDADKRQAFELYELEGMSVAEVASHVGVPENTALYRLHRAREELASKLNRAAVVAEVRADVRSSPVRGARPVRAGAASRA